LFRRTALLLDADADGPVTLKEHVEDAGALVDFDAVLLGVAEHEQVELAAHHLPGLRTLVRLVVPEVERRRLPAAGADELDAVLLDEVAVAELVEHVQAAQHPKGFGDERLADVEAREALALEQLDADAVL